MKNKVSSYIYKHNISSIMIGVLVAPMILHFSLFTWHFKGVNGIWLGFFGSYFGLIGAVSIALIQFGAQRDKEDKKDRENNRSYIVMQDFTVPVNLHNIKTNENSRIIETPGYLDLKALIKKERMDQNTTRTAFMKISIFGNNDVVFDCRIHAIVRYTDDPSKTYIIDINVGPVEKGVEIFLPLVPTEIKEDVAILLDKVTFEYTTLKNERLKYIHDLVEKKDVFIFVNKEGKDEIIFKNNLNAATWIYPNKIK